MIQEYFIYYIINILRYLFYKLYLTCCMWRTDYCSIRTKDRLMNLRHFLRTHLSPIYNTLPLNKS